MIDNIKNMAFKPDKKQFLFFPVGGSQEIGMNANLYCYDGTWILVDCGIAFRSNDITGESDVYVPDLYSVADIMTNLSAIFITHGHDDHIGALQHFVMQHAPVNLSKVPLYATNFTCELIRSRFNKCSDMNFIPVEYNQDITVGEFKVKYIRVTHSIPHNSSLSIKTPVGNIFHSGDWKFDETPVLGEASDIEALRQCGEEGVLAAISDSTNVHESEKPSSEKDVYQGAASVIAACKNRVFVTCFSSNVSRIATFMKLAVENNRVPLLLGYSMHTVMTAAERVGIDVGVEYHSCIGNFFLYDRRDVMVICTGSQGESGSALNRMSMGQFEDAYIEDGDTVVFSSRIIPGNERQVYRVCNNLFIKGAEIVTSDYAKVHVGGHPDQNNIKQMYELIKPKSLIPVHGEFKHIMGDKNFATSLGIDNVVIPRNGYIIDLVTSKVVHKAALKSLIVDGKRLLYANDPVFQERGHLFYGGIITVVVNLARAGTLSSPPVVKVNGVVNPGKVTSSIVSAITKVFNKKTALPAGNSMEKKVLNVIYKSIDGLVTKNPKVQLIMSNV